MWDLRPVELWEHLGGVKGTGRQRGGGEFSHGYTYEGQHADSERGRLISSGGQLSEVWVITL